MCLYIWSIQPEKSSNESIPVFLENDLKPLGHSGQRRLQEVVGSMDMLAGNPHKKGFLRIRETL